MNTIKTNLGELASPSDTLFRFEFDEGYFINSISLRADSFNKALDQLTLIFHESVLDYVSFIHKIS